MATIEHATEIRPFRFEIPGEQLDDLHRRIAATRWPSKELVEDRSQGVQLATMQELARYWADEYDWRKAEAKLNALPQFTTEIDGVEIHFIHIKSEHENALPLVMTHGWPGSVVELLEAIGPLTDPTAHGGDAEDAFDLVLPSIPGYGFSGEPTELGWNVGRMAQAWAELMRRLGYTRYVAQGGDVGAAVTDAMGRQAPEGLLGIHTNLLVTVLGGAPLPSETDEERAALDQNHHLQDERLRLLPGAGRAAADDRLRPPGLTNRPRRLDARPRHGRLLQDLRRLRRREALGQSHAGSHPRQRHAVLADRHRRLGGPVVLGERTGRSSSGGGRPGSSAGLAPVRLHLVPRRDLADPAELGRGGVPERHVLPRGREGRPLRGLGGAGALLRRGASCIQVSALMSSVDTALQPAVARDQARALFGQTMGLVAATAGLFAPGAYVGRDLSYGWGLAAYIASFALLIGLYVAASRSEQLAIGLLFGFGALIGVGTAPTIAYYASTNPQSVWQAGGATALFIAGFGAAGYATRRDLSGVARVCFWALLALIVFGIVAIFVQIPNGALIYSIAGLVIFAGFTAFDFQRLRRTQDIRAAPLLAASIFLDVLNVFLLLLSLFNRD